VGKWGGAAAYLVEYAAPGRRGLTGSWQQVSVGGGFLLGSLTAAMLTSTISPANMLVWGWRTPFPLGVVVGVVGLIMRWRLDDTPSFVALENQGQVARSPLVEAFTTFRKPTLLAFGITLSRCRKWGPPQSPWFFLNLRGSSSICVVALAVAVSRTAEDHLS
jgi:MHS family proline/betaine transporter-like MFS transporter